MTLTLCTDTDRVREAEDKDLLEDMLGHDVLHTQLT